MNTNEVSVKRTIVVQNENHHREFVPPYSLKAGNCSSNHYYIDVAAFADEWTSWLHPWLDELVESIRNAETVEDMSARSFDEIALELLALGVAIHEHIEQADRMPEWALRLLEFLVEQQEVHPGFEDSIKKLRGLVNGLFYLPNGEMPTEVCRPAMVDKLVRWLYVQGAETQARRLSEWTAYMERASSQMVYEVLQVSQEMARRFALEGEKHLGRYAANVGTYRNHQKAGMRWRYDVALVTGTSLEHFLGMLGTEILNRSYRKGFEAARERLVILPLCVCAQPEGQCRAVQTPLGAQCTGCTAACRANQVTVAAARKGVKVVMVPDDELGKICVSSGKTGSGLGVVGVACAMRNWSAGWEARRLGLNAQGIMLDYPGCCKHWHRDGVSTDLNIQQLLKTL